MIGAKMTSEGCGADVEQPACDPITCAGAEDQLPHPGSFSAAPVIAVTGDRAEEVGGIEIVGSDCFSPLDATPHSYKISGNTSLNFPTTCGEGNVSEGALPISSPSDPKLPEQPDNHSDKEDSEDFLLQHKKHVFILTSAGKPLFSRYGDDGRVSELFGVFQVLITMAQHRQEGSSLHWIGSANLNIYFHTDCGLHYVLVSGAGESPYSCKRQLKQLHLQLLSLVPNVDDILSKHPSYDLRRLISSTDAGVLRQLIKRNSREECYLFRCLSAAPLSVASRRHLESLLTGHYRKAFEVNGGGDEGCVAAEHHLFSFLFFRERVVCMVGVLDGKVSLHIDDTLILMNFARCLPLSPIGEIWAPLCLPKFNNTGYLWCYCADMGLMVKDFDYNDGSDGAPPGLQQEPGGITETAPPTEVRQSGLLLVQVASSQLAFAPLSAQAHSMARLLKPSMDALMAELESRANVPLSLALCTSGLQQLRERQEKLVRLLTKAEQQRQHGDQALFNRPMLHQPAIAPMHPDGLQWYALVLKMPFNIIYSEPSHVMRLNPRVRKRQLRLLVKLRNELALRIQNEQLLIFNTEEVNVVIIKPTPTLLTSIVQQFGTRADGVGVFFLPASSATALCNRLQELLLLFSPHVPKHQMLLSAVGVVIGVMAHEAELSLQQPRGSRSRVW